MVDVTDGSCLHLQLVEELESEAVEAEVKIVSAEVLRQARNQLIQAKMEEERVKAEQEEACEEVVADMVIDMVKEVAMEEIEVVEKRKELQKHLAMAECVMEKMMENTLELLVDETATQVLASMEEEISLKVESQVEKLTRRRLLRCFKEWRRLASRGSRQRNTVKIYRHCSKIYTFLPRFSTSPLRLRQ